MFWSTSIFQLESITGIQKFWNLCIMQVWTEPFQLQIIYTFLLKVSEKQILANAFTGLLFLAERERIRVNGYQYIHKDILTTATSENILYLFHSNCAVYFEIITYIISILKTFHLSASYQLHTIVRVHQYIIHITVTHNLQDHIQHS